MKIFAFIGQCPKCKANAASVVLTKKTEENQIIRRRRCHQCGHRWYTLQYPEVEFASDTLKWVKGGSTISYIPKSIAAS